MRTVNEYLTRRVPPYSVKLEKTVLPKVGDSETIFTVAVRVTYLGNIPLESVTVTDHLPPGGAVVGGTTHYQGRITQGSAPAIEYKLRVAGAGSIRLPPAELEFNGFRKWSRCPLLYLLPASGSPDYAQEAQPPRTMVVESSGATTSRGASGNSSPAAPTQGARMPPTGRHRASEPGEDIEVGGLEDVLAELERAVLKPIRDSAGAERLKAKPQNILLVGPPGVGKTLLAKKLAADANVPFHTLEPATLRRTDRSPEEILRKTFSDAEEALPSMVFIDELDSVAPGREDFSANGLTGALLIEMDGMSAKSKGRPTVIAATNKPESIDQALRRPGRFDREVYIPPPSKEGRKEIFEVHLKGVPLSKDVAIEALGAKTFGFTGGDIKRVVDDSKLLALDTGSSAVSMEHLNSALEEVSPSALREFDLEKPDLTWEDFGGYEKEKKKIEERIIRPVKNPEWFENKGIDPPKGIMLHGPPGTGKTLMAKIIASSLDANFIAVKGPELLDKYVGESERSIREVFKRARATAPCVIFFDEIDALAPSRGSGSGNSHVYDTVVTTLLTEIDGMVELKGVLVMGATNRPDMVDSALIRPGRLGMRIEMEMPAEKDRTEIFKIHAGKMPLGSDVCFEELAKITRGFSGADVQECCREAAYISGDNERVWMDDFLKAIEELRR